MSKVYVESSAKFLSFPSSQSVLLAFHIQEPESCQRAGLYFSGNARYIQHVKLKQMKSIDLVFSPLSESDADFFYSFFFNMFAQKPKHTTVQKQNHLSHFPACKSSSMNRSGGFLQQFINVYNITVKESQPGIKPVMKNSYLKNLKVWRIGGVN
ncbi:unnamed protein product [Allacma fusca]|uniref:Uncharacterized protein n=1 Tax=Allacma fusca TaxID=39272 RepID=A0A8J2LF09_9HEXA|nr:unnamed protein product [Allacma fusca]